ncbi:MAG: methionine synthase [Candidatus Krumholzibacteriota bacterium]|nr:methionine synthase [Candidatus Krumholzibacteriota bacterium]
MTTRERLDELLAERILVLDGAMGTMIQMIGLDEAAFRGARFAGHDRPLHGDGDILCLSQPEAVGQIHMAYLEAGADIVTTNSFTATRPGQADYGVGDLCGEINRAAAELARAACDTMTHRTPHRPRFVAGSVGPTNRSLSLPADPADPGSRAATFDELREAYEEAVRGLVLGGADLLLVETVFDSLNAKAALFAIDTVFRRTGARLPVMLSASPSGPDGRLLTGQTLDAFLVATAHGAPFCLGLNCSTGAREMEPHLAELAELAPGWVSAHPNAGFPDEHGHYGEAPEETAALVRAWAEAGLVNIVGGCCGTTPDHVRAIADAVAGLPPRPRPSPGARASRFSGLETLRIFPESRFQMVGERANVGGSRRFRLLVEADDLEGALGVAREQVRDGANLLDVNMDAGLVDAPAAMRRFLALLAADPETARLPVVVDSSRWEVIEAGLQCLPGKGLVNSLDLGEGEDIFLERAELARRYGAAVVAMARDEEGQALMAERKVAVLERAWHLLTERAGFPSEDVVLDPGVLAVGTGLETDRGHAREFLTAVPILKKRCPGALVSAGVSNLSYAFRGHAGLRAALHAVFLTHAIRAGLDLGIVNAGQLAVTEALPADLREACEDLIFNRRPDAAERLIALADREPATHGAAAEEAWRREPVADRLAHALIHGVTERLAEDLAEARQGWLDPLAIIEGPLMAGMETVGRLFDEGKMFLPQIVRSARVMRAAVDLLAPELAEGAAVAGRRGRVLLATVHGDVHDIGKNLVAVVLGCHGFAIEDLGVAVTAGRIVEAAAAGDVAAVGLSGLITPSLAEMAKVARALAARGLDLPLLIGGATTSPEHTALRLAPEYGGPVIHVKDAARAATVLVNLVDPARSEEFLRAHREEQDALRQDREGRTPRNLLSLAEARRRPLRVDWDAASPPRPSFTGRRVIEDMSLETLAEYLDWRAFLAVWDLRGSWPGVLQDPLRGMEARRLHGQARALLAELEGSLHARAVYGFWPAAADGDDIVVYEDEARRAERLRLPMLRQQVAKGPGGTQHCLADFLAPAGAGRDDWLGAFALTAGLGAEEAAAHRTEVGDEVAALMVKVLADRLAEAFAERLHEQARRDGSYGEDERRRPSELLEGRYRGIRPAVGFPAIPDHSLKHPLFELLEAGDLGLTLTETGAMRPAASLCGLYLGHPEARYFDVGRLGRDQVEDYARRRGMERAEAERWLAERLAYEPAPGPLVAYHHFRSRHTRESLVEED